MLPASLNVVDDSMALLAETLCTSTLTLFIRHDSHAIVFSSS